MPFFASLWTAVTITGTYPLPLVSDCTDSLREAKIFTALGALRGYWQVAMNAEDQEKTTFISNFGANRYPRLIFGLRNAPATFQHALHIVRSTVLWKKFLVYIKDVVIFPKDNRHHVSDIDEVLTLLSQTGVTFNLSKCHFFQKIWDILDTFSFLVD